MANVRTIILLCLICLSGKAQLFTQSELAWPIRRVSIPTVDCNTPTNVTGLVSSVNTDSVPFIELTWDSNPLADSYIVYVGTNTDITNITYYSTNVVTTNYFALTGILTNVSYYFNVVSSNECGISGDPIDIGGNPTNPGATNYYCAPLSTFSIYSLSIDPYGVLDATNTLTWSASADNAVYFCYHHAGEIAGDMDDLSNYTLFAITHDLTVEDVGFNSMNRETHYYIILAVTPCTIKKSETLGFFISF